MIGFIILAIIVVVVLGLVLKLIGLAIGLAIAVGIILVAKKLLGGGNKQIKGALSRSWWPWCWRSSLSASSRGW